MITRAGGLPLTTVEPALAQLGAATRILRWLFADWQALGDARHSPRLCPARPPGAAAGN
jgi:hypothetical protein